jgi:hypothetical protein
MGRKLALGLGGQEGSDRGRACRQRPLAVGGTPVGEGAEVARS